MWKRLMRYQHRVAPLIRYSTNKPLSYVERTRKYFNDNPYLIVSMGFVGVVLVFGFIVDSITRKKKISASVYQCLPPTPCHPVVPLYATLLHDKYVLLTGPQGCGKTTLAYRTSQVFLQKWSLWNRRQPRVFYVDSSNKESLIISLRECLLSYGLTNSDILPKGKLFHYLSTNEQLQLMISALRDKLTSSKNRWLLIIDNITNDTVTLSTSLADAFTDDRVIAVSCDPSVAMVLEQSIPSLRHVSINRPSEGQCFDLLQQLSSHDITDDNIAVARQLADMLDGNPLAISCAAVTMVTNGHTYSDYVRLLRQQDQGATEIYINEVVKHDPFLRHSLDFIASLHSTYPIPIPVLLRHLKHPEYHVAMQQANPSTNDISNEITEQLPWYRQVDVKKWWQLIGQIFQPVVSVVNNGPPNGLYSPLLGYQDNRRTGVPLVYHGNRVHEMTKHLYLEHTVQLMEQEALQRAKEQSHQGWFSSWRGFDEVEALHCYRRQLPGIASSFELGNSGAMTTNEYKGDVSYAHYQQLVEHSHSIMNSVTDTHNCVTDTPSVVDKDLFTLTIQAHMIPHLEHLLTVDHVSPRDKARALEELALAHMMIRHTHHTALQLYEQALNKWEGLNGSAHPLVAHVTKEIGNVYNIMDQSEKSLQLMEKAVAIYKLNNRSLTNKQLLQQAECLSSLAVLCGNHGDKKRARKLIEEALTLYEKVTIATEGNISDHYKYQIASLMTDLGHVLLYLGELPLAKKYLDMANMSHRNLHGSTHSELARCLTVQSIMYALLGDREESKRVRQEAGTIENKLQVIPVI